MASGQTPNSSEGSDALGAQSGLMLFMADQLRPGEQIRAVLSKTGTESSGAVLLASLINLGWLAESLAGGRAIVVTDQRVFVVHVAPFGSSSVEGVYALQSVDVVRATPVDLRLRFDGTREDVFSFGKDLRQEADDVVRALTPSTPKARSRGVSASVGSTGSQSEDTGVWPTSVHRTTADWLALFLGMPLGVLLMLGVLVPFGEPDAAEVTFLFSLVVIVAGLTVGSVLRGGKSRHLALAGEAILGLGLGVGIGFLLVFVVPLEGLL